jgi:paraquat-inducible protein A
MIAQSEGRAACIECDLIFRVGTLRGKDRADCPRCGHSLSSAREDGFDRSLAFAVAACVLMIFANSFPFMALQAKGLEQVMTLPQTGVALYEDGFGIIAVLVLGTIVAIPTLILATLLALLVPLRRGRGKPWLVPAGRLLFALGPWSMVEVFVIGVLVSLVKISAMASVVLGLSFWAYVAFAICFTASLASLDQLSLWNAIERSSK